jgi:hypothetical protein
MILRSTAMPATRWTSKPRPKGDPGLVLGFRSGLEEAIAEQIRQRGLLVEYEKEKIAFVEPEKIRKYTPDFKLPCGIYIETKGRLTREDRQKHIWVKHCNPDLDIRFVFQRSASKLEKGSPTTYADWCRKNGFLYADKFIPEDWFLEAGASPC